jgi:predicted DNA-binding protein
MDPFADIDLDAAAVWLDGAWYTRDALTRRIKEMIEAGDFRVSRPSQALERLEAALAASRVVAVRMPADLAASVETTAARLERPAGHLIREAIAYYLAAAEAYVAQAEAAAEGAAPVGMAAGDADGSTAREPSPVEGAGGSPAPAAQIGRDGEGDPCP